VSLWDIVIQFSVDDFFGGGCAIESLKTDCYMMSGVGTIPLPSDYYTEMVDEKTTQKAKVWLERIVDTCMRVGMNVSAETAKEILGRL